MRQEKYPNYNGIRIPNVTGKLYGRVFTSRLTKTKESSGGAKCDLGGVGNL